MLFNSLPYIFVFLPVVIAGFYTLAMLNKRAAQLWLAGASLFFYGFWNPIYLPLLLGSLIVNYLIGSALLRVANAQLRKLLLVLGVALNLGLLGYFKYAGFLISNIDAVSGADWVVPNVILPIGISFITFQKIGFLVDTYRSPRSYQYDFLEFALFVTFFPQLISGPIVRHYEIIPQFENPAIYRPNSLRFAVASSIFLIALFKKVCIADGLASIATPVFAAADGGTAISSLDAWLGALAYTFQIYFDFSAYSELAAAAALMLGIRLPINFFSPYKSVSVQQFWRRWHMSLSRFLRDYLYIPLGGNRRGHVRRSFNVLVTMLLGGLWHGAGWTFVAWGFLHGVALIAADLVPIGSLRRTKTGAFVRWALTFMFVVGCWIVFRAQTLSGAGAILAAMVEVRFEDPRIVTEVVPSVAAIAAAGAIAWLMPNIAQIFSRYRPMLKPESLPQSIPAGSLALRWRPSAAWGMFVSGLGLAAVLAIVVLRTQSEFLYFRF
jgi:D-alanyl-lipoteichoic acid acyltransferase DltB (MBOAT superfamily)